MSKKVLKLSDVAKHLGIPRRTLYRMIEDGRFDVKPIPGTNPRRWHIDAVNAWCEA